MFALCTGAARAAVSAVAIACSTTGFAQAQHRGGDEQDRERVTRVAAPVVVRGATAASVLHMQREGEGPVRPYAFEAMPAARGNAPSAKPDAAPAPAGPEKAPARLTPEERRQLRQNIQEVGREVYRR